MRKVCTLCKYYPRSWWRKLFNIKPVYKEYAKCEHPFVTSSLEGGKYRCSIERKFNIGECSKEGRLFEHWDVKIAKEFEEDDNSENLHSRLGI